MNFGVAARLGYLLVCHGGVIDAEEHVVTNRTCTSAVSSQSGHSLRLILGLKAIYLGIN